MDVTRLLLHPVRLRIVNAILDGREFTTAELGRTLTDLSSATVYRHLAELRSGGLVEVIKEEQTRGTVRRSYRLTARRPLLADDDVSHLTTDDHQALLTNLATTMVAEFGRAANQPGYDATNTSYRQFALWLTAPRRNQLARDLENLINSYTNDIDDVDDSQRHLLTVALFASNQP